VYIRRARVPLALRLARSLLDARARAWVVLHVALRTIERVAIGLAALWLGTRGLGDGVVVSLAVAVAAGVRGISRLPLVAAVRTRLYDETARGLLGRDPMAAPLPPREALDGGLVDALYAAEALFADLLPGVVADGLAAAALAAVVAPFLPLRIVLVALAALLVAGALAEIARRAAEHAGKRSWDAFTPVADGLALCLHAVRDVRGNGAEGAALAEARRVTAAYVRASRAADLVAGLAGRAPFVAAVAVVVGALVADEWARNVPPAHALEEVLVLAGTLPAFGGLARGVVELGRAAGPLRPLAALLVGPSVAPISGGAPLPALPAEVRCERVRYAYPGGTDVLRDVSMVWPPATLLAIAGPNGAGKSTLLGLLAGLATPPGGSVRWGGTPLAAIDASALREEIAYLPQRPYLPPGSSLRSAMRLVAPGATDARFASELRRVDLWDRLQRRGGEPLDAPIDALSAGERQRVAIARVLSRDAALVLLDEPDADLDAAGLRTLIQRLRELASTRMVAVVAHAPEVLAAADVTVEIGPR
jgi:ABC-type multidrug transport system fused ATPase/permease subunit